MTKMTITAEIEALNHLSAPELVKRFQDLWGYEPRIRHMTYLRRRCAWKIQEQRLGGLSPAAQEKLDELIANLKLPLGTRRSVTSDLRSWPAGIPKPGSVITREYKDDEIRVIVRDDGFEWQGLVYRSLTAVAKAVTGAKWNGKAFFGLTPRSKTS